MVVRWVFLWLSLVSSSGSYNYPAWPEQLVDIADDAGQLVDNTDYSDGDAPERQLLLPLPLIADGMLGAIGLAGRGLVTGAVKLLTGPAARAVVKFAGVLFSVVLDALTSDGQEVTKYLHASHDHRHHLSQKAIDDMQEFLDIDFSEDQISHATENMLNHIAEDPSEWLGWWAHGMKNRYVGRNTKPPMEDAWKWAKGFSLDVGHVLPVD